MNWSQLDKVQEKIRYSNYFRKDRTFLDEENLKFLINMMKNFHEKKLQKN